MFCLTLFVCTYTLFLYQDTEYLVCMALLMAPKELQMTVPGCGLTS